MPWDQWVMDATLNDGESPYLFCPIQSDGTIVTGMNVVTDKPPGRFVGIVHADGQEAVEAWCEAHPEAVEQLSALAGGES